MSPRRPRAIVRPGSYGLTPVAKASNILITVSLLAIFGALGVLLTSANTSAARQTTSFDGIANSARASTLAQRVMQDVLRIALSRHGGSTANDAHADLNDASNDLDRTIAALAASTPAGPLASRLETLRTAWSPIRKELALMGDYPAKRDSLDAIVDATLAFGTQLSESLGAARNEFTMLDAQDQASSFGSRRTIAIVAVSAALALIIGLIIRFGDASRENKRFGSMLERMVADLAKSSLRMYGGRDGNRILLDAADDGMFVLDPQLRVREPISRRLQDIFRTSDIEGKLFRDLMLPLVSEALLGPLLDAARDIFADEARPHSSTGVTFRELEVDRSFAGESRLQYLDLNLRPICEDDRVVSVFASFDDVSERVRMARDLRESERNRERQQAFIEVTSRLTASELDHFITEARGCTSQMEIALQPEDFRFVERGHPTILRDKLDRVVAANDAFIELAAAKRVPYLSTLASAYGEKLEAFRISTLSDSDMYLRIMVTQAELRAEIEQLASFRSQFARAVS